MELRTLSYFLAVAREENMTEAANLLHVTQPTLSRQIADLEDELGKKLFTRTNRRTLLTEDGMHLRRRAEEILSLVEQTEDELKENADEITGCLRIGMAETRAARRVTDLLDDLQQRCPRITYEIFVGNIDVVEERLMHGLLDFALILHPATLENFHALRLPERIRLGLMVRADSPLAEKPGITPEDLKDIPLLLPSRASKNGYDLAAWSHGALESKDLRILGRFDLISNATYLIERGRASALAIDGLIAYDLPHLAFVPLVPEYRVPAYLIWKKYRLPTKVSSLFLEELQKQLASAPSPLSRCAS